MSLFDIFAAHVNCPSCGDLGARRLLWTIKCRNMACQYFDPETLQQAHLEPPSGKPATPRAAGVRSAASFGGTPFRDKLNIQYRNFRGEDKNFVADAATARRRGNHISICVQPTGKRIALSRDRIANLQEVERMIPSPVESRILSYHRHHGSSSPRYEDARRKYPHLA